MTRPGGPREERGVATVQAVVVVVLLLVGTLVCVQAIGLARMQHRTAAAADLAALAAAGALAAGSPVSEGCDAAREIAAANGGELTGCTVETAVATVEVSTTSERMWGRTWTVSRRARAAPDDWQVGAG